MTFLGWWLIGTILYTIPLSVSQFFTPTKNDYLLLNSDYGYNTVHIMHIGTPKRWAKPVSFKAKPVSFKYHEPKCLHSLIIG